MTKSRHSKFFIFFAVTISLFLWRLIILNGLFLKGDNLLQFYPWLKIYAESIKSFQFPFWTRYMHSGFPLMAEGQVGGFYPLNIIIFFTLPFRLAYNYSVVLHFILAGIFTYLYTRRIGAGEWGGALAALLFCFGSAYAGCFYNIVTLKTLAWFPLVLLLLERFLDSKPNPLSPLGERVRVRGLIYITACGIIAGMQFLAGFFQMAAYSFVFYIIYLLYGFRLKKIALKERAFPVLIFTVFTFIMALPQVILTYHLAQASARTSLSLGFALWRSFPPPFLLGIFFPHWMGFLGQHLYISVLGIFLLIYGLLHTKAHPRIRPLILIAVIGLLAALGKYNPLYVAMLKLTGFYSFRNPSKFLFFASFAGSVLAGLGFSKLFNQPDKGLVRPAAKIFTAVSAISLSIFFVSGFILYRFKDNIILKLQDYTQRHIFGKPYHRYDLQVYMEKARSTYTAFANGTDLSNLFVCSSIAFVSIGLITGIYFLIKSHKIRLLRVPIFIIIFLDICAYNFIGSGFLKGQIKPFESLRPTHQRILEILKADNELFRIAPFDLLDEKMPYWARPNANILQKIDSIAAYTPLVEKDYKDRLSPLEVVDDSLGLVSPSEQALAEKYQLLRLLNVKYIISGKDLKHRFLKRIASDEGVSLYIVKDYLPRVFFSYGIDRERIEDSVERLEVIEYRSGLARIKVSARRDGFLVFSENYYPGWTATVNGKVVEIIPVKGIAQALRLEKGEHQVTFKF